MFEYRRLDRIFEIVSGATYTTVAQLCDFFKITDRTLRHDISTLNGSLEKHGAKIKLRRNVGYCLDVYDDELYQLFLADYLKGSDFPDISSSDDRFRLLLKVLLESTSYIPIDELARTIAISDSAIQEYLRNAKEVLNSYGIEYVIRRKAGIRVFGREEIRRECFVSEVINRDYASYATGFTAEEQLLFEGVDLQRLTVDVKDAIAESHINMTDYGFKNILVHLALMVSRIKHGFSAQTSNDVNLPEEARSFVTTICSVLEKEYDVIVPDSEHSYIARHLAMNAKLPDGQISSVWIDEKVENLLAVIAQDYSYDLRSDQELRQNLAGHLSSVFRAINLDSPIRNPLINTIKRSFPLQFEIALISTQKVFSQKPFVLSEDDVGYIALHIGAAILRSGTERNQHLKVLLVCSYGKTAGNSLVQRIRNFFSASVGDITCVSHQEYLAMSSEDFKDKSFIVSTVPLNNSPLPSVLIDFALTSGDIKAISRMIQTVENDRFKLIDRFFSPDTFSYYPKPVKKDVLLEEMCRQLENSGVAPTGFCTSVLEREGLSNTAINDLVAIPHTMKPIALETKTAVAILKNPLDWGENSTGIRIVFLLAVGKGDQKGMEHLYDLLVRIIEEQSLQKELLEAHDFESLHAVLSNVL